MPTRRILIVSATAAEAPRIADPDVTVLTTGVGMVATAAWCSRALSEHRYDLALNVGVCGSFTPRLPPGTVVHVTSDCIAELGAQDGDDFLSIHELSLLDPDQPPFRDGRLISEAPPQIPALAALPAVSGITVNTVHGNKDAIERVSRRLSPDVESMEGAAFMYACLIHRVPFAQLRAVSNIVERRNRAAWRIEEAIRVLHATTGRLLEQA